MDVFEHLETDSVLDLQVSVANGDVSTAVEVVSKPKVIGYITGSGVGAAHRDEVRCHGLPQGGIAGADEHSEQVIGMARSPNASSFRWGPRWDPKWKLAPLGAPGIRPMLLCRQCNFHTLVEYGSLRLAHR